jgi:hypothetical protein
VARSYTHAFFKSTGVTGLLPGRVHAGLNATPDDWSPDGKWIVYEQSGKAIDLWLLPLEGDR